MRNQQHRVDLDGDAVARDGFLLRRCRRARAPVKLACHSTSGMLQYQPGRARHGSGRGGKTTARSYSCRCGSRRGDDDGDDGDDDDDAQAFTWILGGVRPGGSRPLRTELTMTPGLWVAMSIAQVHNALCSCQRIHTRYAGRKRDGTPSLADGASRDALLQISWKIPALDCRTVSELAPRYESSRRKPLLQDSIERSTSSDPHIQAVELDLHDLPSFDRGFPQLAHAAVALGVQETRSRRTMPVLASGGRRASINHHPVAQTAAPQEAAAGAVDPELLPHGRGGCGCTGQAPAR